ncbi:unnamed protein product [Clonostachys rosea f. rosea IK726]|uniref:Glutathione S-transferase n=2 Tax=Bionectria ochroleuca TaxID=29856 RepID=A0A0B7K1D5_BIOOC|nr:unnamed protein product [Clonostachys rosea f. rosea IK726]
MATLQPLTLYAIRAGANPWKVAYILEELGLPYKMEQVEYPDLKKEPFLSLNPNGRVPVLQDPNNQNMVLWESGAIIDYLIDVYDKEFKLHHPSGPEKYATWAWEHFQMSGQGPYFGQKAWFERYHAEKLPSAIERYRKEIKRVLGVVDSHLAKQGTDYLTGNKVTYADIMFIPYFKGLVVLAPEVSTSEFKTYEAWLERLMSRPAVAKVWANQSETLATAAAQPPSQEVIDSQ